MQSFVDLKGRTWDVAITVEAMKRVKRLTGVDLCDHRAALGRLTNDLPLLCDVLFAVLKPQADSLGVSDEQFGEGLAGDVIAAATDAFLDAWVAFSPPGQRAVLARLATAGRTLAAKVLAANEAAMGAIDVEQWIETEVHRLGSPSTAVPASSGSTPTP